MTPTDKPPMLPETPDCGAPCAICEAHAHNAARAQSLNGQLNDTLDALRAELESVRTGSAKVCRELREKNAKLRTVLTEMQFAGHVGYVRTLAAKTLEETL